MRSKAHVDGSGTGTPELSHRSVRKAYAELSELVK